MAEIVLLLLFDSYFGKPPRPRSPETRLRDFSARVAAMQNRIAQSNDEDLKARLAELSLA